MLEINKVYYDDSKELLKNIDSKTVDLVVIDPPYKMDKSLSTSNSEFTRQIKKYNKELIRDNLVDDYDKAILDELIRVMKKINIYIWCSISQIPFYIDYFVKKLECKMEVLVRNKTNPIPLHSHRYLFDKEYCLYFRKGGYCSPISYDDTKTVYYLPTNVKDKKKWGHPTIKPLSIFRTIIRNSSNKGDLVLDCFLGSGTTAVACILENRNYIGIENNLKYFDVANNRISSLNNLNDDIKIGIN